MNNLSCPIKKPLNAMTSHEVAEFLGVSTDNLCQWRKTGRFGPHFTRIGSSIVYMRQAVERWQRLSLVAGKSVSNTRKVSCK